MYWKSACTTPHSVRQHPIAGDEQDDCLRKAGKQSDERVDGIGQKVCPARRDADLLGFG